MTVLETPFADPAYTAAALRFMLGLADKERRAMTDLGLFAREGLYEWQSMTDWEYDLIWPNILEAVDALAYPTAAAASTIPRRRSDLVATYLSWTGHDMSVLIEVAEQVSASDLPGQVILACLRAKVTAGEIHQMLTLRQWPDPQALDLLGALTLPVSS